MFCYDPAQGHPFVGVIVSDFWLPATWQVSEPGQNFTCDQVRVGERHLLAMRVNCPEPRA
jgi:hypothetical protein